MEKSIKLFFAAVAIELLAPQHILGHQWLFYDWRGRKISRHVYALGIGFSGKDQTVYKIGFYYAASNKMPWCFGHGADALHIHLV